jgi:hypothetical protein
VEAANPESPELAVLDSVRCLECGEIYSKPAAGSTVEKNPGCPVCRYVGWIPVSVPGEQRAPRRFGADRPQGPSARSH